jgi:hypothetical protein
MARERRGHTLQPTALVNEAFMRLIDAKGIRWQDRSHFLGIAARLMRRVLVDHARARGYQKRGGGVQRVTLTDALAVEAERSFHVIDLDRALEAFAAVDPRKAKVVELRFFGGLSVEETADMVSDHPAFLRYYQLVAELQAAYGQRLWVGAALAGPFPGWTTELSLLSPLSLPATRMARLHALNLATWRQDPYARAAFASDELDHLRRS